MFKAEAWNHSSNSSCHACTHHVLDLPVAGTTAVRYPVMQCMQMINVVSCVAIKHQENTCLFSLQVSLDISPTPSLCAVSCISLDTELSQCAGLFLSRAAVGLGEGVAPSSATDMVARVISQDERSRAMSFIFGGLHVGSLLGLFVAPPLIQRFGWPTVFYAFGLLGQSNHAGFTGSCAAPALPSIPRAVSVDGTDSAISSAS